MPDEAEAITEVSAAVTPPGADAAPCPHKVRHLDISEFENGYAVYDAARDRMHHLSPSALVLLELCTGRNTPAMLAAHLQNLYGLHQAPKPEVHRTLSTMERERLVEFVTADESRSDSLS